jgi:hypothetical protein
LDRAEIQLGVYQGLLRGRIGATEGRDRLALLVPVTGEAQTLSPLTVFSRRRSSLGKSDGGGYSRFSSRTSSSSSGGNGQVRPARRVRLTYLLTVP